MSRFSISELKTREQKIGVWISSSSICNTDLVNNLEKIGRIKFYETIERIIIQDVKDDLVLFEVWLSQMTFRKLFRAIFNLPYEVNRYTVFTCWEKSSLNWICEGDLGKGYTEDSPLVMYMSTSKYGMINQEEEKMSDEEIIFKYWECQLGDKCSAVSVACSDMLDEFCTYHNYSRTFVLLTLKDYYKYAACKNYKEYAESKKHI